MTQDSKLPDYKGDGVAVWVGDTKTGEKYLYIKILGSIVLRAFKVKEIKKEKVEGNSNL